MPYSDAELTRIYDRTSGYCHICKRKMSFTNYGKFGARGAWEVEHSVPRAKRGTDHGNNLFGAHISCNREKSDLTTRTARSWHGNTRAPLSREKRKEARTTNAVAGGVIGGIVGAVLGPWGVAIGAGIGAKIGHSLKPD
ncbi:MAG: endonuclease [Acidobacteria bacterium 13_2_20CM_2_57_12]|nr:MAG: endonuclease [Acidobacteria bacterium 13_2_20CM_2_57_12]